MITKKCDSEREDDVANRKGKASEASGKIVRSRHEERKGWKSRNTTPLLGLKTTRLHLRWYQVEGVSAMEDLRHSCIQ